MILEVATPDSCLVESVLGAAFKGRNMQDNNSVDLSPAATTIAFDPIIPLLRVPLQAGENDDPSKGPYVLAFKDEDSWRRAWLTCESKLVEQCEAGARMGCSVGASNKCKPPWWKTLFQFGKITAEQIAEREACEEHEMKACLVASRNTCVQYAKETCRPAFASARIAKPNQEIDTRFTTHNFKRVIPWKGKFNVKSAEKRLDGKQENPTSLLESGSSQSDITKSETNYRGSTLLGESNSESHWKGPVWGETPIQGDDLKSLGDGWEGGLVRPKIGSKQLESSSERGEVSKPALPIWNHLQQQIMTKLKDLKIV